MLMEMRETTDEEELLGFLSEDQELGTMFAGNAGPLMLGRRGPGQNEDLIDEQFDTLVNDLGYSLWEAATLNFSEARDIIFLFLN